MCGGRLTTSRWGRLDPDPGAADGTSFGIVRVSSKAWNVDGIFPGGEGGVKGSVPSILFVNLRDKTGIGVLMKRMVHHAHVVKEIAAFNQFCGLNLF